MIVDEKDVKKHLANFDSANIVGKKSIALATSLGLCKISESQRLRQLPKFRTYKFINFSIRNIVGESNADSYHSFRR